MNTPKTKITKPTNIMGKGRGSALRLVVCVKTNTLKTTPTAKIIKSTAITNGTALCISLLCSEAPSTHALKLDDNINSNLT
jgi:hypothetical protein